MKTRAAILLLAVLLMSGPAAVEPAAIRSGETDAQDENPEPEPTVPPSPTPTTTPLETKLAVK